MRVAEQFFHLRADIFRQGIRVCAVDVGGGWDVLEQGPVACLAFLGIVEYCACIHCIDALQEGGDGEEENVDTDARGF